MRRAEISPPAAAAVRWMNRAVSVAIAAVLIGHALTASAQPQAAAAMAVPAAGTDPGGAPAGPPDATIDLTTDDGVRLVGGAWRYSDARIVEVEFRAVGEDLRPSGPPNRTYDIEPRAGAADSDDSAWPVIPATSLAARRANGRLSFNWYRIDVTVPDRIGGVDPTGATLVLDIVVDDYAEVWVDGVLPRTLGAGNENLVQGWNAPNRLVIAREARPGQRIRLAVFGINGPLSDPPPNYIWIRSARIDVYRPPAAQRPEVVPHEVVRLDAGIDAVVPRDATLERIATGFLFTEGPVWLPEGALLFSDPNANRIYRWSERDGVRVFRENSGYAGPDIAEYRQPGSNGLTLDPQGRLTAAEHGNRRITRTEPDGSITVLADRWEGRRLNSPNDLVYRSDGSLYFGDPPFGLPGVYDDARRELDAFGVYLLRGGRLQLLTDELRGPNGIALSPDEAYLYVGNWDEARKVVMRYPVRPDGTIGAGRVFLDLTAEPGEEAIDGVKVDRAGNVYVSGPGGLWIVSPEGRRLGLLRGPEQPANFAWGGADGRTLFLTARTGVYRIRLGVEGVRP